MNQPVADYTFLQNTTWRLKAVYPLLRVKTLGKSVVGRSIYGLEIGRETAPCTLLAGTFWGTDGESGPMLLQFAEALLQAVTNGTPLCGVNPSALLNNRKITIIPFVNPDGREICARGAHCAGLDSGRILRLSGGDTTHWDANARGVDISRNFDFCFLKRRQREQEKGIYGPGNFGYSGPSPESEPETVAVADYCRRQKTVLALSFYPGSGEIYWRNSHDNNPRAHQLGNILAVTAGYDVEADVGAIVDNGFRNWVAMATHSLALDCMMRCNQNPIIPQDRYSSLEEMLVTACLAGAAV